jgi:excisionase family DNA binding protein
MKENFTEKRLMTIKEVAHYLGISPQTIRNHLCRGTFPIPPVKIGGALRWDRRDVDKFINNLSRLTKPVLSTQNSNWGSGVDYCAGLIREEVRHGSL